MRQMFLSRNESSMHVPERLRKKLLFLKRTNVVSHWKCAAKGMHRRDVLYGKRTRPVMHPSYQCQLANQSKMGTLNCECGADATWMCSTPMILPCIETTVAKTTMPPTDSTYPLDPICGGALSDMCALKGEVCVDGGTANAHCVEKEATKGTMKGPTRPPTVASLSQVDRCAAHSGNGKHEVCKKLFPACRWTQRDTSCVVSTATAVWRR